MSFLETGTCAICGHTYTHFGNNPEPLLNGIDRRVCDDCNNEYVIPYRIALMNASPTVKKAMGEAKESQRIFVIKLFNQGGKEID